jgi:RNA polymerase-binding protein DksA
MTGIDHGALAATLTVRRAELARDVAAIGTTLQAPLAADFAEQASESEESQTLEALEIAHRNEIDAIDTVLARLANGTYGVCSGCGGDIAPARLKAQPTATRCIACAA